MASRLNTGTMPVKRSSVPTVKSVDLRDINNAFAAVEQQLRILNSLANEANLKAGQAQVLNSQGTGSIVQLQQQLAALQGALTAVNAFSAVVTLRADADVTINDVVYPTSNGGVSPVDTEDPTAIFAVTGVAETAATAGGNTTVRRYGPMTIDGASFELGRAVYAQVGEGLTQFPNYAAVAIPVGVAAASNVLEVRPGYPALLSMPLYSGGYEQFMPVALALVENTLAFVESIFGQADGIVVKIGDQLVTREIVTPSGSGLSVVDGDGVFGNPSIE